VDHMSSQPRVKAAGKGCCGDSRHNGCCISKGMKVLGFSSKFSLLSILS
jgi:hypothetical protein